MRVFFFGLASMAPVVGSVAAELTYFMLMERSTCRRRPLGVDLWLVRSTLNACFNVDTRTSPRDLLEAYMYAVCTPTWFQAD